MPYPTFTQDSFETYLFLHRYNFKNFGIKTAFNYKINDSLPRHDPEEIINLYSFIALQYFDDIFENKYRSMQEKWDYILTVRDKWFNRRQSKSQQQQSSQQQQQQQQQQQHPMVTKLLSKVKAGNKKDLFLIFHPDKNMIATTQEEQVIINNVFTAIYKYIENATAETKFTKKEIEKIIIDKAQAGGKRRKLKK